MLMNDKIIFDRYCCINSANHWENEDTLPHLIYNLITFSYAITLRKVPREVLKTEGEARGFQPSRGTCEC